MISHDRPQKQWFKLAIILGDSSADSCCPGPHALALAASGMPSPEASSEVTAGPSPRPTQKPGPPDCPPHLILLSICVERTGYVMSPKQPTLLSSKLTLPLGCPVGSRSSTAVFLPRGKACAYLTHPQYSSSHPTNTARLKPLWMADARTQLSCQCPKAI